MPGRGPGKGRVQAENDDKGRAGFPGPLGGAKAPVFIGGQGAAAIEILELQAILLDQPLSPTIEPRAASYRASLLSNFTLRPIDDSHIELSANGLPPTIVTRQL